MKVKNAYILKGMYDDTVVMVTDLPDPDGQDDRTLVVSFECAAGTGDKYVRDKFNIEVSTYNG